MIYIILSKLLPHHNNVRTTTIVVVVAVHTLHIILKYDRTHTVIRTSKCTVQMITNPKKIWKKIFNFKKKFFLGVS